MNLGPSTLLPVINTDREKFPCLSNNVLDGNRVISCRNFEIKNKKILQKFTFTVKARLRNLTWISNIQLFNLKVFGRFHLLLLFTIETAILCLGIKLKTMKNNKTLSASQIIDRLYLICFFGLCILILEHLYLLP